MTAVGVVVEYNPFHNGHAYHLQEARRITGADTVVAVMSGYFLQRGEPAVLPRRMRTKMALLEGADIVIELPYAFSSQHASVFAHGAISILQQLGTDYLCFGSEAGTIEPFLSLVSFLNDHRLEYDKHVRYFNQLGYSYPRAAASAFKALSPAEDLPDIAEPNNSLGLHYIQSIKSLGAAIEPVTIKRTGSGYHDKELTSAHIASATAIRKILMEQTPESVEPYMPASAFSLLTDYAEKMTFVEWEHYFPFLQAKLLSVSPEHLSTIYEAEEGIDRLLAKHAREESFSAMMAAAKTKRYTTTRLQRASLQLLLGVTKSEMAKALTDSGPQYMRLLGMTASGRRYLQRRKKSFTIPLKTSMPRKKIGQALLEDRASFTYYLPFPASKTKRWKEEYTLPPLIL